MLQELTYGRLENEYYPKEAKDTDMVICVQKNKILLKRLEDGSISYPTAAQVKQWSRSNGWTVWKDANGQPIDIYRK